MSKPGLHLINVSSLSFIKKNYFAPTSNFLNIPTQLDTAFSIDFWHSEGLSLLYVCWFNENRIFIIKIFWEHVDWNYPQFHTEFVGIKILSPLSSISFLLPIFPVSFHIFPSILFFTSLKIVDLSIANIFANLYCFSTELYKSI